MTRSVLDCMAIPRDRLGEGCGVRVVVGGDADDLAWRMAEAMAGLFVASARSGRPVVAIVPVGPVGQYPLLARLIAERRLDGRGVTFVMMDEFLDDDGRWIDERHPLSFRGFLRRTFLDALPTSCGFGPGQLLVPEPSDLRAIPRFLDGRGGADVTFAGIGLNGHLAFNEPEEIPTGEFASRTCRVLEIAPASRAHMAVNLSCALDLIPTRAVTVGMREILGSRSIRVYANRPWQNGVVRLALHGEITARCPASLLRTHPDVELTITAEVAEPREMILR